MGGDKIKSKNIEIAILIFKLLHRARGVESTDAQTDRHTDRQTESFFMVVVNKGLRRRFASQTRTARVFRSLRRGPVPAPVRGCEGGRSGR